jgi:hypothetical protein
VTGSGSIVPEQMTEHADIRGLPLPPGWHLPGKGMDPSTMITWDAAISALVRGRAAVIESVGRDPQRKRQEQGYGKDDALQSDRISQRPWRNR